MARFPQQIFQLYGISENILSTRVWSYFIHDTARNLKIIEIGKAVLRHRAEKENVQ